MSVIKRRYTKNFTTIGNALFDDERLTPEAMGILAWLRSRPDNWQVMPGALAKRFRMGIDRTYRILNELVDSGWISRTQHREGNRFAHGEYVVYDEPVTTLARSVSPNPDFPDAEAPDPEDGGTNKEGPLTRTDPYQEGPIQEKAATGGTCAHVRMREDIQTTSKHNQLGSDAHEYLSAHGRR